MAENNKSLYTFGFKLILFVTLLISVLWVFVLPYAPKIGVEKRYVFELNKLNKNTNDYDLALFGNSYVYTAYDPSILRAKLGLNTIHINSPSQILETSLILAEVLIEKNNFKYVLFDVSENSVLRPNVQKEKSWYFQTIALQEIPFSFNKFRKANNFFPKKDYNEYYFSSISEKTGKLFRLNKRKDYLFKRRQIKYYHFKGALFSENGYFAYDYRVKSIDEKDFDKIYNKKAKGKINSDILWNYDLKQSMIDVIELAQSKHTQVILVNSLKLRQENFNRKFIDSLTNVYSNVKFLNFNENRTGYNLNKNSFFDSSHLTYLGSHQVTNRLVDSLSNWYNIPKQNKNKIIDFQVFKFSDYYISINKTQDSFIKLEFDSIPKALQDHTLVISLYPKDSIFLSDHSKKKNFKSDNFYIKNIKINSIDLGNSKMILKRLKTKIGINELKNLKIYFYKKNDTLKLPSFNLNPEQIK